jgi:hypothetical protein
VRPLAVPVTRGFVHVTPNSTVLQDSHSLNFPLQACMCSNSHKRQLSTQTRNPLSLPSRLNHQVLYTAKRRGDSYAPRSWWHSIPAAMYQYEPTVQPDSSLTALHPSTPYPSCSLGAATRAQLLLGWLLLLLVTV